jgi:hypothetical protein
MRHQLLFRLLACTALALSAGSVTAAVIPDGATATVLPLTVTCSTLSGNDAREILSHCTGSGAVAKEAGKSPTHGTFVMSAWTITWADGKQSRVSYDYKLHTGAGDTCTTKAGYSKERMVTETGQVGYLGTSTVGMINGTIKATVCVYEMSASPHTIRVVNQGNIKI